MKRPGVGSLFSKDAHGEFMRVTGQRYDSMDARMEKKKLPPLPFTKVQFRSFVIAALGGTEDGAISCRYCRKICTISEVAVDHEMPLSRGGSAGLENLGLPCSNCNQAKGSMAPGEFLALIEFLETKIPRARTDVLGRLAKAIKLAAGARRNAVLLRDFKSGKPKAAQKTQTDDSLPPF